MNRAMMYAAVLLITLALASMVYGGDMMRKSIVFDKKTPDVFYCPQHKPTGFDKMIVRARPLSKLCEHEGKKLPEDYKSDCYNDVDESEYACKEKYRIMKRLVPKLDGSVDISSEISAEEYQLISQKLTQLDITMRLHPPGSENLEEDITKAVDRLIKKKH